MHFFVPAAENDAQAEQAYASFAKFVNVSIPIDRGRRIAALDWEHNGQQMSCKVGEPMPPYYQTGQEPVLAIFDGGTCFKICTPSRGGIRGEPILAGYSLASAKYFSG